MLCTPTSTFLLRTITLSNSLLICRTPTGSSADSVAASGSNLEIRGIEHQVLECMPQAADLERIRRLLRDTQWEGLSTDSDRPSKKRRVGGKRWTRNQLESVIQASSQELERGLKERNVIEVDGASPVSDQSSDADTSGHMTLLPSTSLKPLLNLLLTLLTVHSTETDLGADQPAAHAPRDRIEDALAEDHDVPRAIAAGVLDLFGTTLGSEWVCDIRRAVKEIGRGILPSLPARGKPLDAFLAEWRGEVGEAWEDCVDVKLLEVSPWSAICR